MSNVRILQTAYEAFERGDVPAVLGAMDARIEWREAEGSPYEASGGAWIGPEAVLNNLFMKLGSEWDAFTVHPETFHDAGDSVVVEGRYRGRYQATGKSLDAQFCHIWKLRDEKVTRFQGYVDTAEFQDVTGRSPQTSTSKANP